MALPARSVSLAGASAQSLLPALWCHLDAPGVHGSNEAMQEADIATELEHGAARCSLASDVAADLLDVDHVRLGQEVDQHLSDVAVGRWHGLQGDSVSAKVRQAAAHAWVDGKDAFHLEAFLNTASS